MKEFMNIIQPGLLFVYQCFDRVVISGYLSMLSRPENLVYFFREVCGVKRITKEILRGRTRDYQRWVEAFAMNHGIPCEWAEKGVRKEDFVRPQLRRMERRERFGVYYILKSMEQGPSFRSITPRYETEDPDWRIIKPMRGRYTHYYFYIRDEVLGAMVLRMGSFLPFQAAYYLNGHNFIERWLCRTGTGFRKEDNAFLSCADPQALRRAAAAFTPEIIRERLDYWTLILGPKFSKRDRRAMNLHRFYAITQVEYCRNFVFRRNAPIRRIFERACDTGLARMTADTISQIFGVRITKRSGGKLKTTLDSMDQGAHVLRAYLKNAFVKQYEKYRTFLRHEVCANNLADFRIKKNIDSLPTVAQRFSAVLDRFADAQAGSFNLHRDLPLLQRLARPVMQGSTRVAGIKLHDTRILRLMRVLLHNGTLVRGLKTADIHTALLETFGLKPADYTINQLRYDMRKMKAHALIERDGKSRLWRFTKTGVRVSTLMLLFHDHVIGPVSGGIFGKRPVANTKTAGKFEAAYEKIDKAFDDMLSLLAA